MRIAQSYGDHHQKHRSKDHATYIISFNENDNKSRHKIVRINMISLNAHPTVVGKLQMLQPATLSETGAEAREARGRRV